MIRDVDVGINRATILRICIVFCVLNIGLTLVLAGTGVLKTARQGDVTYVRSTQLPAGEVTLPPDAAFVIEDPTDVDFYYNIAVHVRHGGSLYPGNGDDPFVQLSYKYAPVVFVLLYPLSFLGYLGFKLGWLLLSLGALIVGTYLLLRTELHTHGVEPPTWAIVGLSLAAVGFHPMIANLKTGQTTPLMYFFVALAWWLYRRDLRTGSGAVLIGATVVKPYFTAPLIALFRKDEFRPILGFGIAFVVVNMVGVLIFDIETLISYYRILWSVLVDERTVRAYDSFEMWSASQFRPFFWLGSFATVIRIVFVVSLAFASLTVFLGFINRQSDLFCLAIISLMLFLSTTTAIDLGMLLVVLIILGTRAYAIGNKRQFRIVGASFLLLMGHGYVMELLVGWGARNIPFITANEQLVITLLPVLQPATYAVLLLWILAFRPFLEPLVEAVRRGTTAG